jgi:hypothetical protein
MSDHDDLLAAAAQASLFATHGEQVVFRSKDGSAERSIWIIPETDASDVAVDMIESNVETIVAEVLRDPLDADWGGVAQPIEGDAIIRDGDDANGPFFVFTGRVHCSTSTMWALEFSRPKIIRLGKR